MTGAGAPYAPFMEARTAKPPGLSPLDPEAWIACDADYAAQMAERDRLLTERPEETTAETPDAGPALAEFRERLLAHLSRRAGWRVGPETARRPDGAEVPRALGTLALAGRLCQEDVLLMAPATPEYRLIAGVLCFPSRWTLSEKIGRGLTRIHAPVPDYAQSLARRVNRVFEAIAPERPLMRVNWLVHATDRLDLPQREGEKAAAIDAARGWFLRTERQTLLRLPRTRVVAFGVKTTVTPVEALTEAQRGALGRALADWEAGEIAYRGGTDAWLKARAAVEGAGTPSRVTPAS